MVPCPDILHRVKPPGYNSTHTNDPLVIRAKIGKSFVNFARNNVGRILVDNGSSADILVWQCFVKMVLI